MSRPTSIRLRASQAKLKSGHRARATAQAPSTEREPRHANESSPAPVQPARVPQRVAPESLAARVPARVHIPIYCPLGTEADTVEYMLELLFACLHSYFAHDNAADPLVTTNDYRVLRAVGSYKIRTGHRFELLFVSQKDLLSAFRIDHATLGQPHCLRMIFSKFYPIFARLGERIVHVDFDTLFMMKVDLEPLFVSDIGLVDTSPFDEPHFWYPNAASAKFFRIDPAVRPVANWLNSGVFSIQKQGFEICRAEVDHYLKNIVRAARAGVDADADEGIMNALAIREPGSVAVIRDATYNFLAYHLWRDPSWSRNCKILHFHSLKPQIFHFIEGAVHHRFDPQARVTDDFYLAALIWYRHLHAAVRAAPRELPSLRRMPLEVVNAEYERAHERADARARSLDRSERPHASAVIPEAPPCATAASANFG